MTHNCGFKQPLNSEETWPCRPHCWGSLLYKELTAQTKSSPFKRSYLCYLCDSWTLNQEFKVAVRNNKKGEKRKFTCRATVFFFKCITWTKWRFHHHLCALECTSVRGNLLKGLFEGWNPTHPLFSLPEAVSMQKSTNHHTSLLWSHLSKQNLLLKSCRLLWCNFANLFRKKRLSPDS